MSQKFRSNHVRAALDATKALRDALKKYTLPTRKLAWKKLTDDKSKSEVSRLIQFPNRSSTILRGIMFKEWLSSHE